MRKIFTLLIVLLCFVTMAAFAGNSPGETFASDETAQLVAIGPVHATADAATIPATLAINADTRHSRAYAYLTERTNDAPNEQAESVTEHRWCSRHSADRSRVRPDTYTPLRT